MGRASVDKSLFVTQANVQAVRALVRERAEHPIVVDRRQRNVEGPAPELDRERLWHTQVMCLLTSQQPSSWADPVPTFLRLDPFPLSLECCQRQTNLQAYVCRALNDRSIRFSQRRIPEAAARNLRMLEEGGWDELMAWAQVLHRHRKRQYDWARYRSDLELEEKAADYADAHFKGFGPKQARNFWQALGLTRHVCVIDSRIRRWCCDHLAGPWDTFEPSQITSYRHMANILQEICLEAAVLPCMFDAAAFSYAEREEREPLAGSWCRGD